LKLKFQIFNENRRDIAEYKLMIVVLICHGLEGDVLLPSSDLSNSKQEGIRVNTIAEKFLKMKNLEGKSKILIVEACRGDKPNECSLLELKV